ncbi:unnamed protein product [Urochloa humidicola]
MPQPLAWLPRHLVTEWPCGRRRAAPDPPPLSVPPSSRCSYRDLRSRPSPIPSDLTTVNPISYKGILQAMSLCLSFGDT